MSDDVVSMVREGVIEQLSTWTEPNELAAVLDRLDAVPFDGDVQRYLAVAKEVLGGALEAALAPRIQRLRAETAKHCARIAQLEADYERSAMALSQMNAGSTIH